MIPSTIFARILFVQCALSVSADSPRWELPDVPTSKDFLVHRVFEEVLIPWGSPAPSENAELARALEKYVGGQRLDDLAPLEAYVQAHPKSAWRFGLLVNMGLMYRHVGRVSKAVEAWELAWAMGVSAEEPVHRALASRALGELLEIYAGLGRLEDLERLVREAERWPLNGLITEKVAIARESLNYMRSSPDSAYRCGPVALSYIHACWNPFALADVRFERMVSSEQGTSLAQNARWARELGMDLVAARGGSLQSHVPALVHWKTGHFSAVLAYRNGRYHVQDPFLGDAWISERVIAEEGSGFALIPKSALASGWTAIPEKEAENIWGRGAWGPGRPDDNRPDSHQVGHEGRGAVGEPQYSFLTNVVGLKVRVPLVEVFQEMGLRADFQVTYNQREYGQPQVFDYCNMGPKWSFSYLACIKDDTTNSEQTISVCHSNGGGLHFLSRGNGTFQPDTHTMARLHRNDDGTYVIAYPDGRREWYELADRAWGIRRLVVTRVQDRLGNEIRLGWDPNLRLLTVKDNGGACIELKYEQEDPLKPTSITYASRLVACFTYDAEGRLASVDPVGGAPSRFLYGPTKNESGLPHDFLRAIVRPIETHEFRGGEDYVAPSHRRWLEATRPDGSRQRLEGGAGYAYAIDPVVLPNLPQIDPAYHPNTFSFRESFYWNHLKPEDSKPDYRQASHYLWGHGPGGFSSGLLLSYKVSGNPRIWQVHAGPFRGGVLPAGHKDAHPIDPDGMLKPGQTIRGAAGKGLQPMFDGAWNLVTRQVTEGPGKTIRVVSQEFSPKGRLVARRDDSGRVERWEWDEARDVVTAYYPVGSAIPHRFYYGPLGQLERWDQPGGEAIRLTYNAEKRLESWSAKKGAKVRFHYGPQGDLTEIRTGSQRWAYSLNAAPPGNRFDRRLSQDLSSWLQRNLPAFGRLSLLLESPKVFGSSFQNDSRSHFGVKSGTGAPKGSPSLGSSATNCKALGR